jgi:hypothetical protein
MVRLEPREQAGRRAATENGAVVGVEQLVKSPSQIRRVLDREASNVS